MILCELARTAPITSSPLADSLVPLSSFCVRQNIEQTSQGERQARLVMFTWLLRGIHGRFIASGLRDSLNLESIERFRSRKSGLKFNDTAAECRLLLFGNARSCDLKLLTVRLFINCVSDPAKVQRTFLRAGFSMCEVHAYLDLLAHPTHWTGVKKKLKVFASPKVRDEIVLSPGQLRRERDEDFAKFNLLKTAKGAVRRKLRFVVSTGVVGYDDLEHELMYRAASWYAYVRPFVVRAHAVNYARNAIASGVQELIEYWTAEERAPLIETENGWDSRVIGVPAILEGMPCTGGKDHDVITEQIARQVMKGYDFNGAPIFKGSTAHT